jgi:hypothetical protein
MILSGADSNGFSAQSGHVRAKSKTHKPTTWKRIDPMHHNTDM